MTRLTFYRSLVALLLCSLGAVERSNAQPEPEYPTFDPTLADYDNLGALLLAEEVKGKYGGKSWGDSLLISFDFVMYSKKDEEIKRTTVAWNRLSDEAVLAGTLDDGRPYRVRFSNLSRREGVMMVDSLPIDSAYMQEGLDIAYQRLRTTFLWLTTPLDLLDSNYTLAMGADTVLDGTTYVPMHVSLNDSTLRLKSILLYIHKTHKLIERWRIEFDGSAREFIWRRTRKIGNLVYNSRLWAADYTYYVQLERVRIKEL